MIILNTSLLCRPARPAWFIHFDFFCCAFLVSWVRLRCTCDYYKNSFYPKIAQWNNLLPEIVASTSPCSFGQSVGNLTLYILISNFMWWFFHYCNFLKQSVKSEDQTTSSLHFFLRDQRLAFLAWGDFHACPRFARSTTWKLEPLGGTYRGPVGHGIA